ncbi:MAG: hypothetical protein HC851_14085 [Acaryochloris sp. RU_4_1]|nr:hypothetical protein [Acaryochloris sp. RU_4_1]NJR55521.1 hypothetical protein [Acaryochloris sp. CRU_2_0]
MLSYALVLIVGLGSIGLYLTAYLYPEIHRKTDVWWSGIGLFYALILLIYRQPIGLLLGHVASVVLLVWLSYQALQRRWTMVIGVPPQPKAGTISARTRHILDQLFGKIAEVNWQGLWQRLGTQAKDGTSNVSILPPALKQRLDFTGFLEKLKGTLSRRKEAPDLPQTMEATPPEDQQMTGSAITDPTPPAIPTPAPPAAEVIAPQPTSEDLPAPTAHQSEGIETLGIGNDIESVEEPSPDADKAELVAELDQVMADLSPDQTDPAAR